MIVAGSRPNNRAKARRDTIFLPVKRREHTTHSRQGASRRQQREGMRLQHREGAAGWRHGRSLDEISAQTRYGRHRILSVRWDKIGRQLPVVKHHVRHFFTFERRGVFLLLLFLLTASLNLAAHWTQMLAVKSLGNRGGEGILPGKTQSGTTRPSLT